MPPPDASPPDASPPDPSPGSERDPAPEASPEAAALLGRLARRATSAARRMVELTPFPQPPLRPTRYPVVLMHGFGALANARAGGVLHAEALHLRTHGVAAYAPQVNPYDTVAVRAATWRERVEALRAETGAAKVSLVGFSTGGLDARYLAGSLGYADRVAAIVTVATPHRGSALARFVLDQPERLSGWAVAFMDFVGRAAYDDPPHARQALEELTPEYVAATFDPAHPVPEGVYCASYAARAGKGTDVPVFPPLVVPNRVLHRIAGENDGIVATASARWGEDLGTLDADHARLVGFRTSNAGFDAGAFYLSIADHLRAKGF